MPAFSSNYFYEDSWTIYQSLQKIFRCKTPDKILKDPE